MFELLIGHRVEGEEIPVAAAALVVGRVEQGHLRAAHGGIIASRLFEVIGPEIAITPSLRINDVARSTAVFGSVLSSS